MSEPTDDQAREEHYRRVLLGLEVMRAELLQRRHRLPGRRSAAAAAPPAAPAQPSNVIPFRPRPRTTR